MRRNYGSLNLAALDLHQPSASSSSADSGGASTHALAHDLALLHVDDDCYLEDCCTNSSISSSCVHPASVGFPIELFAHMQDGGESDDDVASQILQMHERANAPRRRKRSFSDHRQSAAVSTAYLCLGGVGTPETASRDSASVSPAAMIAKTHKHQHQQQQRMQRSAAMPVELSPRLPIAPPPPDHPHPGHDPTHQRHHMELHALRCLSLNLMLSSSVPSGSSKVGVTAPQPSTSVPKMSSFEIGCQPQVDRATAVLHAGRRGSLPRNMIQSV